MLEGWCPINVGELFVSLGVKGTGKAIDAIDSVKKGLQGIASTSLETKAAIVAAIYALERLFTSSGQRGTALENFSALSGIATKTVQQYQWAAQQVGLSNEEVTGTFINLQKNMTKTLLGKGAPEGLGMFARKGGNVTSEDIAEYQKHPEELLQKLQQYAQTEKNVGLRNEVLESFGVGGNMIAALQRNAFNPKALNSAPTYSDQQITQLDKANVAWKNLGSQVEMIFGKLNARHGAELVGDVEKLIGPLGKVIESLVKLAEKIKLFEGLRIIFEGMAKAIDVLATSLEKLGSSKFLNTFMKIIGDSFAAFMKTAAMGDPTKELGQVGKDLSPAIEGAKEAVKSSPLVKPTATTNSVVDLLGLKPILEQISNVKKAGLQNNAQDDFSDYKENPPKRSMEPKKENDLFSPQNKPGSFTPTPQPESLSPQKEPKTGAFLPPQAITPTAPMIRNNANNQNVNVNQTMNFQNDGSNAKQVGDSAKKMVQNAFRQIPALAQGA